MKLAKSSLAGSFTVLATAAENINTIFCTRMATVEQEGRLSFPPAAAAPSAPTAAAAAATAVCSKCSLSDQPTSLS